MILDRTKSPEFQVIKSVVLPEATTQVLAKGIPLHIVNIGEQPVLKIELLFDAGTWYESVEGASYFAAKMLQEGTIQYTASQISEKLERAGAFIELAHSVDKVGVVVYCLNRMLPEILPIMEEMVYAATFPEKEFEELKNITLQHLKVNEEKVAWVAGKHMKIALFGEKHPYGRYQTEDVINQLQLEDVKAFYQHYIQQGPVCIFLSGMIGQGEIEAVQNAFNKYSVGVSQERSIESEYLSDNSSQLTPLLLEKKESIQSAIRIGTHMFTRSHPDYFKMQVVNEILGGYFGSRLMKNIREEKGLTYGISSMIYTFKHAGFLTIGTDVKREFTEQTIEEIKKEIVLLQTEKVSEQELQTVKNFMSGEFAGSLNTAFDVAERRKILLLEQLPADFYSQYIQAIHETTSDDILTLANKYLAIEQLKIVVAGGY